MHANAIRHTVTLTRNAAGLALLTAHFAACAYTRPVPRPTSLPERLAMLPTHGIPLDHSVAIHWSDHQVPFIEAASDADLATALGLVHAHLRIGQMEMVRRLSQGRLSEMIGPIALDLDHLLRILDFGRAVPEMLVDLPEETRRWLEAFVGGINHYLRHAEELPHEFAVLNLKHEPWSASDVLRIGRLAAADVNWIVWLQLLPLCRRKDWPRIWRRLMETGAAGTPYPTSRPHAESCFVDALGLVSRWASNSVAISASRSASGGALIASDPHLGIHLPSPWLIAGYKSPAHHAVGLMVPGLPFIALGRNPWIAWGGTNLHAASSDFYDVSDLPEDAISERRNVIKVRWWPDQDVVLRDTPLGPVISDARLLGLDHSNPIALHWMGHRPSDEITAMLKLNQARNWDEFRAAANGISVSGQTMTYADAHGRVGRAMAVRLPARQTAQLQGLLLDHRSVGHWKEFVTGSDLPAERDPPDGFVVSANERPGKTAVPVGFFFSPPDRARRLRELIGDQSQTNFEDLGTVLTDVHVATSIDLCRQFLRLLQADGLETGGRATAHVAAWLSEWDGRYEAVSRGALAFELVFRNFIQSFYGKDALSAYWATWQPRTLLLEDLRRSEPAAVASLLRRAMRRSARAFERFGNWGGMHRLRLVHPLGHVPIFGRRYVFSDTPAAGGSESIHKTSHRFGTKRHGAVYGSTARHVSDLSDPDRNGFVLLGGQDGWLGSANYADQLPLWRRGEYLQVPLRPAKARARFPHRIELLP